MPYKDPEAAKRNARKRYLRDRQARVAYARRERREQPQKLSRQRKARYQVRKEETAADRLAYQRAWHVAHPGYAREQRRRWVAVNPGAAAEYQLAWQRQHSEAVRAYAAQRRGQASLGMTEQDKRESIEWRKLIANDPCFYCGAPGTEDDHYVAVANGGTDHWWNLVRACRSCNRSKKTMDPEKFLALVQ